MTRRLAAVAAVLTFLGVALGIRLLAGGGVLDGSSPLLQHSGTALYASMVYAAVFVAFPAASPPRAAAAAIAFCWAVELFQLTGVPAALSERSLLARLALGVQFDATDLLWYVVGVLPVLAVHLLVNRRATAPHNRVPAPTGPTAPPRPRPDRSPRSGRG